VALSVASGMNRFGKTMKKDYNTIRDDFVKHKRY
jgi:hypothetical protein